MRNKLLAAVAPLENVPDSEKDWHPGSDGLVLDLVHPSLYPILYGHTVGKVTGSYEASSIVHEAQVRHSEVPQFVSERFQWIPSDFSVDDEGKVTLTSPYINNVHPVIHKELYSVIPKILQHAIPMFEHVLSDLIRSLLPMRIATSGRVGWTNEETVDCIWGSHVPHPRDSASAEERMEDEEGWYAKRVKRQGIKLPAARKKYRGDLEVMKRTVSLKGRSLQVIVKLANIVLTPEKPEYPGGKWHVEGKQTLVAFV